MAKGQSSASSATRKKHARKAAAAHGELVESQPPKEKRPKGEKKGKKNKEPKKKAYIPPVKPAPVQPDPLDTLGIAQRIPADLLVVLRLLAKKDSVTKRRALEDLQAKWVDQARKEEGHVQLSALAEVLPVWVRLIADFTSTYIDCKDSRSFTMYLLFSCTRPAEYVCSPWDCMYRFSDSQALYSTSSSYSFTMLQTQTKQNISSAPGAWLHTTLTGRSPHMLGSHGTALSLSVQMSPVDQSCSSQSAVPLSPTYGTLHSVCYSIPQVSTHT